MWSVVMARLSLLALLVSPAASIGSVVLVEGLYSTTNPTSTCPAGTVLLGCVCHSAWRDCEGAVPNAKTHSCTAHNYNNRVRALAICGKDLGPADSTIVQGADSCSSDGCQSKATCPSGFIITGCTCHNPYNTGRVCDGAFISGGTCVAQTATGGVQAFAICQQAADFYASDGVDVTGDMSTSADDALSHAYCPPNTKLTSCSCFTEFRCCDGAYALSDTHCAAANDGHGPGVYAKAHCMYFQPDCPARLAPRYGTGTCASTAYPGSCSTQRCNSGFRASSSMTVTCGKGGTWSAQGTCQNINECAENSHNCHELATCTDTIGSFTCTCFPGYSGSGVSCTNIDECKAGGCHDSASCVDNEGGFECQCPQGLTGAGVSACANVNECAPPASQHVCVAGYDGDSKSSISGSAVETTLADCSAKCIAHRECVSFSHVPLSTGPGLCNLYRPGASRLSEGSTFCALTTGCRWKYLFNQQSLVWKKGSVHSSFEEAQESCLLDARCAGIDNRGSSYYLTLSPETIRSYSDNTWLRVCDGVRNDCHADASCLDNTGSWSCACNTGYTDASVRLGTDCVDVDECMNPTQCVGACHNVAGSYYCGPVVTVVSANGNSVNPVAGVGDTVTLTLDHFTSGVTIDQTFVVYGSLTNPARYSCANAGASIAHPTATVTCLLELGLGRQLSFSLRYCWSGGCAVTAPDDTAYFSYPDCALTAKTLDYGYGALPPGGARDDGGTHVSVLSVNTQGELLQMEGTGFVPPALKLVYGPDDLPCEVDLAVSTDTLLVCNTGPGGSGIGNTFTVIAGEYETQYRISGVDRYNYPEIALVNSTSGCIQDGPRCYFPTDGGIPLFIEGIFFQAPLTVFVGGSSCQILSFNDTHISCTVPEGTGIDQALLISSGGLFSPLYPVIDYALPVITSIATTSPAGGLACSQQLSALALLDCPRKPVSGSRLVIRGDSMGSTGAVVIIGGDICLGVQHLTDLSGQQTGVSCDLPEGTATDVAVFVILDGQVSNSALLSFTQCTPGTFVSGRDCLACPLGRYSDRDAAQECSRCSSGRFAGTNGSQTCRFCGVGEYQDKMEMSSCKPCLNGTFSDDIGRPFCEACLPGRFADGPGSVGCADCEPGYYAGVEGMSQCVPCAAGKYLGPGDTKVECKDCNPGEASPGNASTECTPCEVGAYQQNAGQQTCVRCPVGRFSVGTRQVTCEKCVGGTYQNETGQPQCHACPLGKVQPLAEQANCTACLSGTFSPAEGQRACTPCDIGTISNGTGNFKCSLCPVGTHQSSKQASDCLQCPIGTFNPSIGQSLCLPCLAGTSTNETGRVVCDDCAAGRFQDLGGATVCQDCEAGTWSATGSLQCAACPSGRVASGTGSQACEGCPPLSRVNEERTQCLCQPNHFLTSSQPGMGTCDSCPEGADCTQEGRHPANIASQPGFWRKDRASLEFLRCLVPSHCAGGVNSTCDANREGVLCTTCSEGFKSSKATAPCNSCGASKVTNWAVSITILVLACLGLALVMFLLLKFSNQHEEDFAALEAKEKLGGSGSVDAIHSQGNSAPSLKSSQNNVRDALGDYDGSSLNKQLVKKASLTSRRAPDFMYKAKIMVSFFQISTVIAFRGNIPWPSYFQDFMSVLQFFNFDFIPWQSINCATQVDYYGKCLLICLTPIVVLLALLTAFGLARLILWSRGRYNDSDAGFASKYRQLVAKFGRLMLFTTFLFYPHVSSTVSGLYNCVNIIGKELLMEDMTVNCWEGEHLRWTAGMSVFVLLYPIGIPATILFMLYRVRRRMDHPLVIMNMGFLYFAYGRNAWYFEVVDMLHKLILTSLIFFFPNWFELAATLVLLYVYLAILLLFDPYIRKGDDRLACFVQSEMILLSLFGWTLGNSATGKLDELSNILMSTLLITLVVFAVGIFVLMSVRNTRKIVQGHRRKKLQQPAVASSFTANSIQVDDDASDGEGQD